MSEARGFTQSVTRDGEALVEPLRALTDRDRVALQRWRAHVAAVIAVTRKKKAAKKR